MTQLSFHFFILNGKAKDTNRRQRRQREEDEKYAYLPPRLAISTCFVNPLLLQGVRFFILTLLLGVLLITLAY